MLHDWDWIALWLMLSFPLMFWLDGKGWKFWQRIAANLWLYNLVYLIRLVSAK